MALAMVAVMAAPGCIGQIVDDSPAIDGGGENDLVDAGAATDSGPITLADRPCPDESFLTYENFGAPFFSEYCTGCHSSQLPSDMRQNAPPDVNFETLEKVRMHAARIYARAADDNDTMPPAGGPPSDVRELLGEWLACGAPSAPDGR